MEFNNSENTALYGFRKYGDTVLRAAYACCGCYAEAEDITQDVFLLLHQKDVTFSNDEHLKAWLLRVTMNKCKNYKRSFRISRTDPIDGDEERMGSASYSMDTTDVEVKQLIENLPKKYAAAVFLSVYEGLTIHEISEILGKKPNTVSSLIRRGKEKLKMEIIEINRKSDSETGVI